VIKVLCGDVIDVLREYKNETFTACFCDPPYGLRFMGKGWDHGVPGVPYWAEVLRVLKPGAVLLAFGGTRTWHRLACAIEDAGFEIYDTLMWLYGSGFPKSHDISKAIDKAAGARREDSISGGHMAAAGRAHGLDEINHKASLLERKVPAIINKGALTRGTPATPDAVTWDGYGTALKPAWEPIVLARKPRTGTYAQMAVEHGTAALNIEGCRIGETVETWPASRSYAPGQIQPGGKGKTQATGPMPSGRWPANLLLDKEAAAMLDAQSGVSAGSKPIDRPAGFRRFSGQDYAGGKEYRADEGYTSPGYNDTGGASRFFQHCDWTEADMSCVLCGLPLAAKTGIISPSREVISCKNASANGAEAPIYPREKSSDFAHAVVLQSGQQDKEGSGGESNIPVNNAAKSSGDMQAITESTAQRNARLIAIEKSALAARYAASLCDSCATAIARALVQIRQGQDLALPANLAFISERKKRILNVSLAQYVENPESIDIIQIITNLKRSSGFVPSATPLFTQTREMANDPRPMRFAYHSKASRRERDAGLENVEPVEIGFTEFAARMENGEITKPGTNRPRHNSHPCLKPLALCEYLARLIMPPEIYRDEAKLLVPFCG